jgi:hypothetical protein
MTETRTDQFEIGDTVEVTLEDGNGWDGATLLLIPNVPRGPWVFRTTGGDVVCLLTFKWMIRHLEDDKP